MTQQKIMYGEMAIQAQLLIPDEKQITVWFCKKCRRIAHDEHMASWCCCTHRICDCGNEYEKHWTMCDDCSSKKEAERWFAKPEVIWDGEWPLATADGHKYFFDESQLIDWIEEQFFQHTDEIPNDPLTVEQIIDSLRLTSCTANKPREFEVNDWRYDDLGEDSDGVNDAESIDERINAILGEIVILSYSAGLVRLNVRDVLERIGFAK